jgi:hypothetical protein
VIAAIVSAVFQVTGPIPASWLNAIPTGLSSAFQHISGFLASFGLRIAIALLLALGYWKRLILWKWACRVSKAWLRIYVHTAAALLRPVVQHILVSSAPPTPVITMTSQARAVSTLRILAASYGAQGKFNEVSELLSESIKDGRLRLLVHNNLGGDPIHGTEKQLTIDYWHSGTRLSKTLKENDMLTLP